MNILTCRGLEEWKRPEKKVSFINSSTGRMGSDHARHDHDSTCVHWPHRADWTSVNYLFKHPLRTIPVNENTSSYSHGNEYFSPLTYLSCKSLQ